LTVKSSAVSLYLLEPNTCEYYLSVESPWICDFIQSFNTDGVQEQEIEATEVPKEEVSEQSNEAPAELEQNQEEPKDNQNSNEKLANPVKEEQP